MVSVVVTILNESENIGKLLTALINQTKKPSEITIVDGGSKDGTVEIVRKYATKNRIIKLLEKQGNRSVGRNYGIEYTRGEIIAVTDAGGYPKQDWLEKLIKPFDNKRVNVVAGFYQVRPHNGFGRCVAPYFLVMPDKIYDGMKFLPSSRSVAFRKSVWKTTKYPEEYSHNEDLVWDYQLKEKGIKFFFEPKAIVYWYPPRNLQRALKQFFRFAYGDAESGIARPKVFSIYLRYFLFWLLISLNKYFALMLVSYAFWAILKNFKYAKRWEAFFWLPVIQITSDFAIMLGNLGGKIRWLSRQ